MIIDIHTHLFGKGWIPETFFYGVARLIAHEFAKQGIYESYEEIGNSIIETTNDPDGVALLDEMDEAGIDKSILLPIDFGLTLGNTNVSIAEINRKFAALGKKHPDRFIIFAGIDPRRREAVELFTRCVEEWGMRGLKLHPCSGFYPNQQEVYVLLERACKWKIPVLIHSGSIMFPLRSKYAQPIYFDDLGTDFPELPVIAAHAGGTFGCSQMISIMHTKLNIFCDIAAWQITAKKNYALFCRLLRDLMDFVEADRILFGSDSPSFRSVMSNTDWVQLIKTLPENAPEGITFSVDEINKILGENAKRLLAF